MNTEASHEHLHRYAHDLRNKLSVLWEAYRSARNADAEEAAMLDTMAEKAYFAILRANEDLLDAHGVDRRVPLAAFAPVDLHTLLEHSCQGIGFSLRKRGQHISTGQFAPLTLHGDAKALGEALTTCLSNASRFSPQGASISITVARTPDQVHISITDPGVGMSAEDLAHVHERYRILGSRTPDGAPQQRASLARAVQRIADHGGRIAHASQGPGQGTTCTISLPLTDG